MVLRTPDRTTVFRDGTSFSRTWTGSVVIECTGGRHPLLGCYKPPAGPGPGQLELTIIADWEATFATNTEYHNVNDYRVFVDQLRAYLSEMRLVSATDTAGVARHRPGRPGGVVPSPIRSRSQGDLHPSAHRHRHPGGPEQLRSRAISTRTSVEPEQWDLLDLDHGLPVHHLRWSL